MSSPNSEEGVNHLPTDTQGCVCKTKSHVEVLGALKDNDWIKEFYKECGREVTLAYTTLNQMKNWAIVVSAAIAAAIASILKSSPESTVETTAHLVLVGAVLAYLFTVRFFVRAMLCYVNLLKWNVLQRKIIALKLQPSSKDSDKSSEYFEKELATSIENYYYRWLSPDGRWALVTSNLKLGFGLLLAIPILLIVWGSMQSWENCYTRAAIVLAAGATAIELYEFLSPGFLDTAAARKRRTSYNEQPAPGATGKSVTVVLWLALLVLCCLYTLNCSGTLCTILR